MSAGIIYLADLSVYRQARRGAFGQYRKTARSPSCDQRRLTVPVGHFAPNHGAYQTWHGNVILPMAYWASSANGDDRLWGLSIICAAFDRSSFRCAGNGT